MTYKCVTRSAIISPDGLYRYRLDRIWDPGLWLLLFCMLNPSTADADKDDPTIRQCMWFGEALGFGGIVVVNFHAYRATDWRALRLLDEATRVGPENLRHIAQAVAETKGGIFAWGTHLSDLAGDVGYALEAMNLMKWPTMSPMCLGLTKHGHPKHPLYQPHRADIVQPYLDRGTSKPRKHQPKEP
jgi:hypothetical protein